MSDARTDKIIERANRQGLSFLTNFNGTEFALMDDRWIRSFDSLEEVEEYLSEWETEEEK